MDRYGCCSVCEHDGDDDTCDECYDADLFEPMEAGDDPRGLPEPIWMTVER